MNQATVNEYERTADREAHAPIRVHIRVDAARSVRSEAERARTVVTQISKKAQGGAEVSGTGVAEEAGELASRVS